jgi:hypothetical protein
MKYDPVELWLTALLAAIAGGSNGAEAARIADNAVEQARSREYLDEPERGKA